MDTFLGRGKIPGSTGAVRRTVNGDPTLHPRQADHIEVCKLQFIERKGLPLWGHPRVASLALRAIHLQVAERSEVGRGEKRFVFLMVSDKWYVVPTSPAPVCALGHPPQRGGLLPAKLQFVDVFTKR